MSRRSRPFVEADLIVLGPGSLYTSVHPESPLRRYRQGNREVDRYRGIRLQRRHPVWRNRSLRRRRSHHVKSSSISATRPSLTPWSIATARLRKRSARASLWKRLLTKDSKPCGRRFDPGRDVVSESNPLRHDPEKLANALHDLVTNPEPPERWSEPAPAPVPAFSAVKR